MLAKICSDKQKPNGGVAEGWNVGQPFSMQLQASARSWLGDSFVLSLSACLSTCLPAGQFALASSREAVMAFMRDLPIR